MTKRTGWLEQQELRHGNLVLLCKTQIPGNVAAGFLTNADTVFIALDRSKDRAENIPVVP